MLPAAIVRHLYPQEPQEGRKISIHDVSSTAIPKNLTTNQGLEPHNLLLDPPPLYPPSPSCSHAARFPTRRSVRPNQIPEPQARQAARQRQPLPRPLPVRRNRFLSRPHRRGRRRRGRRFQSAGECRGGVGHRGGREKARKVPPAAVEHSHVFLPLVSKTSRWGGK